MKGSRLLTFVGARLRITIAGERTMEGTLMAFDRHMSASWGARAGGGGRHASPPPPPARAQTSSSATRRSFAPSP